MDNGSFDALTRSVTNSLQGNTTRRGVARLLGGLALGGPLALLGLATAEAKCKKKCGLCKRCKKGKCKPKPTGTACPGGTCQRGACVASPTPPAVVCSCPVGKNCLNNGTCAATCDPAAQNCPTSCRCLSLSPSVEGAFHCVPNAVVTCAQVPQSCASTAQCPQGQACLVTQCGPGGSDVLRCVPVCNG